MPDDEADIRELISQTLFTTSGERFNRPELVSALSDLVFEPITPELVTALQSAVQQALDEPLANIIQIEKVQIAAEGRRLCVTIEYIVRRSGKREVYCFDLALE